MKVNSGQSLQKGLEGLELYTSLSYYENGEILAGA